MAKSPRLSFKGYNIKKALYRNKDAVKAILALLLGANYLSGRSEERRVGKECRSRWSPYH